MRRRLLHPSGALVLATAAATLLQLLAANIMSTVFWHLAGGVGELDLDGGANLFHAATKIPLPPAGTPQRLIAIVHAYPASAVALHTWLTCSLDFVLPPTVALLAWVTLRWSANRVSGTPRTILTITGGVLAVAYLLADWTENVLELLLLTGVSATATAKPIATTIKTGTAGAIVIAISAGLISVRIIQQRTGRKA
jgi:hypothetical protein